MYSNNEYVYIHVITSFTLSAVSFTMSLCLLAVAQPLKFIFLMQVSQNLLLLSSSMLHTCGATATHADFVTDCQYIVGQYKSFKLVSIATYKA